MSDHITLPPAESGEQALPIPPAPTAAPRKLMLEPDDFALPVGIEPGTGAFALTDEHDLDEQIRVVRLAQEREEAEERAARKAELKEVVAEELASIVPTVKVSGTANKGREASLIEMQRDDLFAPEVEPIHLYETAKTWLIRQRPFVKEWSIGFAILVLFLLVKTKGVVFVGLLTAIVIGFIVLGIYLTNNGGTAREQLKAKFSQWRNEPSDTEGGEHE